MRGVARRKCGGRRSCAGDACRIRAGVPVVVAMKRRILALVSVPDTGIDQTALPQRSVHVAANAVGDFPRLAISVFFNYICPLLINYTEGALWTI
ncbi:hypothetical protein BN2475_1030014 [Paraburkholderia ribeironis]|uniref:Uncharacterized protein n=1 Tax=Paraburkholderia ribeironis TaxID=1247936 RepID=A0A1N7SNE6_9BURK|nr:hypothetical protein BN2475_1030014 [Paraburkholderia ribeironis]